MFAPKKIKVYGVKPDVYYPKYGHKTLPTLLIGEKRHLVVACK
jgi:hypothetical protein